MNWRHLGNLVFLSLFTFLVRYRRTVIGPAWLVVGPALFVTLLGSLYAEIGSINTSVFIPHLTIGLVCWTLIQGFVTGSVTVFQRHRSEIMQAGLPLSDIVVVDVTSTIIAFTHQLLIIVAVFLIYRVPLHWSALMSLPGLFVLIINGIWVTQLFGILGVRYRDLSEIFQAVMRIAFLATPIVWMPSPSGRGNIMTKIMAFNPFYHFLEIVRAPLLGQAVSPLSWAVVISFTVVGLVTAHVFSTRYGRLVPLWV